MDFMLSPMWWILQVLHRKQIGPNALLLDHFTVACIMILTDLHRAATGFSEIHTIGGLLKFQIGFN
ncbi:MAG: hypothetical protein DYG88_18035 [Chloroflexi bacterium CFX4]|nr:hypothetical protein [Chloroflexi bacterium CFX4]